MAGMVLNLYCYDFLSGALLGTIPARGQSFGQTLNSPGTFEATVDLRDPRVQQANALQCTVPNRTFIVVDLDGALVWGGIVQTRRWMVDASGNNITGTLALQATELWSYFQQRIQATDYSAPPASGITPTMALWTATPWDASLIAAQVIGDATSRSNSALVPYGNPLGGLGLLINGATPSAAAPPSPSLDWVAVNYPFTSTQTVDTIVSQLAGLGLGVGFDLGVDVAYSGQPGTPPIATINLSYPRRGRTADLTQLVVDLQTARTYEFPETGTEAADQIYEIGGSGAIVIAINVNPLNQGYPLLERVISRGSAQSQNIVQLLGQAGTSDLALYSYAPVAPSVTLGLFDPNLPLGSFIVGDDITLFLPSAAGDSQVFDPRFPNGLNQEWRIVGWKANVADEGDPTLELTLNQPPYLTAIAPAI